MTSSVSLMVSVGVFEISDGLALVNLQEDGLAQIGITVVDNHANGRVLLRPFRGLHVRMQVLIRANSGRADSHQRHMCGSRL